MKHSIADAMRHADGRPSGFDYMRLMLSLLVVTMHSGTSAGGNATLEVFWANPVSAIFRAVLPMFFALSGFLVAGSMERCRTLVKFLGLRMIRIYPALCVEILLSALLLGPLVTTRPLGEYFTDPLFFRYLLNATGDISFFLPGVFADNPLPRVVNGQLWTVPYELLCYIVLAGLIALGAKRWRGVLPLATVLLLAAWTLLSAYRHHWVFHDDFRVLIGQLLVTSFLAGVSLYLYREKAPHSLWLAAPLILVTLVLLRAVPFGAYLAIFTAAYVTVYLGTMNPIRARWIRAPIARTASFCTAMPSSRR